VWKLNSAGLYKQSMGAMNRVGIGFSPARQAALAVVIYALESILGLLKSLKNSVLLYGRARGESRLEKAQTTSRNSCNRLFLPLIYYDKTYTEYRVPYIDPILKFKIAAAF
jgi:hypothetical protein